MRSEVYLVLVVAFFGYLSSNYSLHILIFSNPQTLCFPVIHNVQHPPKFVFIKNNRKLIQKFSNVY